MALDAVTQVSTLTLTIENTTRSAVDVSVELFAAGLDNRSVTRPLTTRSIAAEDVTEVEVAVSDFPIHGVTFSSLALAVIHATDRVTGGDLVSITAPPFYFHFDSTYTTSWGYSPETMSEELDGGVLGEGNYDLQGRVWVAGSFTDIAEVIENEYQQAGIEEPGPSGGVGTGVIADLPDISFDPDPEGRQLCFFWKTAFVDPFGTASVGLGTQVTEASFARVEIREPPSSEPCTQAPPDGCLGEVLVEDILDADGCVTFDGDDWTNYVAVIYSALRQPSATADDTYRVIDHDAQGAALGVRWWVMPFYLPPEGTPLPPNPSFTIGPHAVTHAAAVASTLLRQSELRPDLHITIDLKVNKGCNGGTLDEACAHQTDAQLGALHNSSNGPGPLSFKNVVAHEMGHTLQDLGSGRPLSDYNAAGHAASESLCTCNHYAAPPNVKHCLQSRESASTAMAEGFGHFIAAKTYNGPGEACSFAYYKPFQADGALTQPPPVVLDCKNPVKWRDNECFQATSGTEYDWLQFFWNVNAVGSNTSTVDDLYELYRCLLYTSPSPRDS